MNIECIVNEILDDKETKKETNNNYTKNKDGFENSIEGISITIQGKPYKIIPTLLEKDSFYYGKKPKINDWVKISEERFEGAANIIQEQKEIINKKNNEIELLKSDIIQNKAWNHELTLTIDSLSTLNRDLLNEINGLQRKQEKLMEIYKTAPFKRIFYISFLTAVIGILLLLCNYIQLGALFSFSSASLFFFLLFAVWRVYSVTLINPRLTVVGFITSFGLVITALASFIIK